MLFTSSKSSLIFTPSALPKVDVPAQLPADILTLESLLLATQQTVIDHAEKAYKEAVMLIQREADERIQQQVQQQVQEKLQYIFEQIKLARHRQFGSSSEQISGQGRLFDESEVLAQSSTDEQDLAPIPAYTPKPRSGQSSARGKRYPLPPELERIDIIHDVPLADRTTPEGVLMVEIGQEISEQLDIIPIKIQVLRNIRKRYGIPGSLSAPILAALPPQPLPKSNASPDFLAMLLTTKYVDGLPLARFEKVLARHGVLVPRQTLARWIIAASVLLQPLHNLLRDQLFEGGVLHVDESPIQVLKEAGKSPTSTSYMWVQAGGLPDKPVLIFDYDPSRSGNVPMRLLQDYQGYLMTDGYEGYAQIAKTPGIEHLACWAHARRYFVDAVRVQPKGKRGKADEAVAMIGQLYGIEREHKASSDQERWRARQHHSQPILDKLRSWLAMTKPGIPPQSALGKALAYLQSHWNRLIRYIERGDLPIDNNRCENAIRPFVVGRKGWLFSDTPAGANASALIYSLVETAKANGLEPYTWLRQVMRDLPAANTVEEMEALLPWNCRWHELTKINTA